MHVSKVQRAELRERRREEPGGEAKGGNGGEALEELRGH